MKEKLPYSQTYSQLSAVEISLLQQALKAVKNFVRHSKVENPKGYATRGAHATTYSFLEGTFLPNEAGNELFNLESYHALVRLSHPHLKIVSPRRGLPLFGVSLRLSDHSRSVLNLPLVNFPLFPMVSVKSFLNLFILINTFFTGGLFSKVKSSLPILGALPHVLKSSLNVSFMEQVLKLYRTKERFSLDFEYHSVGAYRFGDAMVKYKLQPKGEKGKSLERVDQSVEAYMANGQGYKAELLVQFAFDTQSQPVNFLNRMWKNSPWVCIGELACSGVLNSGGPDLENLSFNPFESHEVLRPVGKIQALREASYEVSHAEREALNQKPISHG